MYKIAKMKIFAVSAAAAAAIPILILMMLVPNAYSSGPRMDWPDAYPESVEGSKAKDCWVDGFDDGLDHPFNVDRHKECQFDFEGTNIDNLLLLSCLIVL